MYVVDDFLTAEQCDSVITLAEPRLERSQTSTTANISSTKTRSRTSSGEAPMSPNWPWSRAFPALVDPGFTAFLMPQARGSTIRSEAKRAR